MGGDFAAPPPGMGDPGMTGAPLGPEEGIPQAMGGGPPMPPAGMGMEPPGGIPPGAGPSPDLLSMIQGGGGS